MRRIMTRQTARASFTGYLCASFPGYRNSNGSRHRVKQIKQGGRLVQPRGAGLHSAQNLPGLSSGNKDGNQHRQQPQHHKHHRAFFRRITPEQFDGSHATHSIRLRRHDKPCAGHGHTAFLEEDRFCHRYPGPLSAHQLHMDHTRHHPNSVRSFCGYAPETRGMPLFGAAKNTRCEDKCGAFIPDSRCVGRLPGIYSSPFLYSDGATPKCSRKSRLK